MFVLYVKKTSE